MTRIPTSSLLRFRDDEPVETAEPAPEIPPPPPATEIVAVRVSLRERVRVAAPLLQKLRQQARAWRVDAATAPWFAGAIMLAGISVLVIHDLRGPARVAPPPAAVAPAGAIPRAAPVAEPRAIVVAPTVKPEAIVIPKSRPLPMVVLPAAPRVASASRVSKSQEKASPAPAAAPEKALAPKVAVATPESPAVFGSQTVVYTPPAAAAPAVAEAADDEAPRSDYQLASIAGPNLALIASLQGGETVVMPYRKGDRLPDGSTITAIDAGRHVVVTSAGTLGPK